MGEFKVTESGWYRTRDGWDAEVVVNSAGYGVTGYIHPLLLLQYWHSDGSHAMNSPVTDNDLVEYLGKERPKRKKTIKIAPALCENLDGFFISDQLFESEEKARRLCDFVRWLIGTPYAIEVEVEG